MTPEATVTKLTKILVARRDFSEEEILIAMENAGVPDHLAVRAFKFTQVAWGRAFVGGLGVRFSSTYVCFSRLGDVIETGRLSEEPHYISAFAVASKFVKSPGFQKLIRMSDDVSVVNQAINDGAKSADLEMGPAFIFFEAPTEDGLDQAKKVMAEYSAAHERSKPAAKPWWKFW